MSQTVNGVTTNYVLDLAAGLTQVLSDGTNTYLYGNGRIGELQPGGFEYHLSDALGSVRQLTDTGGNVTLARSYEPFGNDLTSAGTGNTVMGFTGEVYDNQTRLLYLRARYLSAMGRFISKDTYQDYSRPQMLNGWGYVEGNPINRLDPSGHDDGCTPQTQSSCYSDKYGYCVPGLGCSNYEKPTTKYPRRIPTGVNEKTIVILVNGIYAEANNPVSDWQTAMEGKLRAVGFNAVWQTPAAYNGQSDKSIGVKWIDDLTKYPSDLEQVRQECDQGISGQWSHRALGNIQSQIAERYNGQIPAGTRFVLVGYSGGSPIVANLAPVLKAVYGNSIIKGVVMMGAIDGDVSGAAQAADEELLITREVDEASATRGVLTTEVNPPRSGPYISSQTDPYGTCEAISNCFVVRIPGTVYSGKGHTSYSSDSTAAQEIYDIFGP